MADFRRVHKRAISNLINGIFTLFVLGLSGLAFITLTYLMRPVGNARKNWCGMYAEAKNSLDVVYFGSSAAYYGWEPLRGFYERGFTSYNIGTDALQAQCFEYEVREVLKTQTPKLLMIEMRPFIYGCEYSEVDGQINIERSAPFRNVSDNMKLSLNRWQFIHNVAPSGEPEWTYQFDLSKYHTLLSELVNSENWKCILNQKHLYSKGFFYHNEARYMELNMPEGEIVSEPIDERVDEYLTGLLEYLSSVCPDKDIRVCFVLMPYGRYDSESSYAQYIKERVSDYGFDTFICMDHLEEIGLDSNADFRDPEHLNLNGANKFSSYFAQYLDETYDLPDHREDDLASQWFEDYDIFIDEISKVEIIQKDYN